MYDFATSFLSNLPVWPIAVQAAPQQIEKFFRNFGACFGG
jgi:hypothetical protein